MYKAQSDALKKNLTLNKFLHNVSGPEFLNMNLDLTKLYPTYLPLKKHRFYCLTNPIIPVSQMVFPYVTAKKSLQLTGL